MTSNISNPSSFPQSSFKRSSTNLDFEEQQLKRHAASIEGKGINAIIAAPSGTANSSAWSVQAQTVAIAACKLPVVLGTIAPNPQRAPSIRSNNHPSQLTSLSPLINTTPYQFHVPIPVRSQQLVSQSPLQPFVFQTPPLNFISNSISSSNLSLYPLSARIKDFKEYVFRFLPGSRCNTEDRSQRLEYFTQIHKFITRQLVNEMNSQKKTETICALIEPTLPAVNDPHSEDEIVLFRTYFRHSLKDSRFDFKQLVNRMHHWVERYRNPQLEYHVDIFIEAAIFFCNGGEFVEAEELMQQLERENSNNKVEYRLRVALGLTKVDNNLKAQSIENLIKILQPLVDHFDELENAHRSSVLTNYLGALNSLFQFKQSAECFKLFETIKDESNPEFYSALFNISCSLLQVGQYEKIIRLYKAYSENCPSSFDSIMKAMRHMYDLSKIYVLEETDAQFEEAALITVFNFLTPPAASELGDDVTFSFLAVKRLCESLIIQGKKSGLVKPIVVKLLSIPKLTDAQRSELLDLFVIKTSSISSSPSSLAVLK